MTRAVAAAVILSAVALTHAQLPRDTPASSSQPSTVTGRVVADDTGAPLPNARVALGSAAIGTPVVVTDSEGRFTFRSNTTGRFAIAASKTGYARREITSASGEPIEIRLPRGAAIEGRVVDDAGDPIINAGIVLENRAAAPA